MSLIDYLNNEVLNWSGNNILLPDDIWQKFELDFPELVGISDIFTEAVLAADKLDKLLKAGSEIRNHDCMWAGHCASKEHPTDEPRSQTSCMGPRPPDLISRHISLTEMKQEIMGYSTGQQSLLKPAVRAAAMPQTPPMSDDEESRTKTISVLKLFHEAETIEECDIDDDSDLCEYFEENEIKQEIIEPVIEVVKPNINSYQFAAESDHSYHKGKSCAMQIANFGIDTPSDSGKCLWIFIYNSYVICLQLYE